MEQVRALPTQSLDWGQVSAKAQQDGWKRRKVLDFFLRARFTPRRTFYKEVSDGSGYGHLAQLQTVVRRGRDVVGVFDYEYRYGVRGTMRTEQVVFSAAEMTDGQVGTIVQASVAHLAPDAINQVIATFDPDGSLSDCTRTIIPARMLSQEEVDAMVRQQGAGTMEIGVTDPATTHMEIAPSVFALMDNLQARNPQRPISQLKYITR